MVTEERARETAVKLSEDHPGKLFWVYRTPAPNHWVRQDDRPIERHEGVKLVAIAVYMDGKEVGEK